MSPQRNLKILFVLNPHSGGVPHFFWRKKSIDKESVIREYLKNTSFQFEFYHMALSDDSASIKHWIHQWKPDRVVAIGGDGTVRMIASILVGTNIPLGIIPSGSANGLAKDMGLPNTVQDGLDIILYSGTIKTTDLIVINQHHHCIHLSDIGMNAQLVKYFQENDIRGKLGYAQELFKVLWRQRWMEVTIVSDQMELKRKAFMVVLANARMYGTGVKINPTGDMQDGLFEVVILRKLSFTELFKMLFLNRRFNPQKTEVLQAEQVTIHVKKKVYFQIDGEYLGKTKYLTAEIMPKAIQLIYPT